MTKLTLIEFQTVCRVLASPRSAQKALSQIIVLTTFYTVGNSIVVVPRQRNDSRPDRQSEEQTNGQVVDSLANYQLSWVNRHFELYCSMIFVRASFTIPF